MPVAFIEQRFPEDISYGSKGGPTFYTSVYTAASGYEQRNINWESSRGKYDISYGIKDKADMDVVLNFFYAMRGRATGFRFKDWTDYKLTQGLIGVGTGALTTFQITKKYTVGSETYTRVLRKIVAPVVGPPAILFQVYVNDVLKTIVTDYTVNYNTGIITFTTPPPAGHTVKVTCEFDVPVRFDIDELPITLESFELETLDSIPLIEIKTEA